MSAPNTSARGWSSDGSSASSGADAAGAGGRRAVVDPRHELGVPAGVDRLRQLPSAGRQARRRPVTLASSRAFQATSALKPTEPTANAGLWSGAPLGDRSIEATSVALQREPRRRGPSARHRVVPAGAVVAARLPRVAQLHQAARRCGGAACRRNSTPRWARSHQLVVERHPEPGELGDGVAVHGRLGDRRRLGAAPERRVGEGPGAVAKVRHEAVVVLRRQRAAELAHGPLVAEVGPHDGVEAAVPQPLPRVGGGVRHAEAPGGVVSPRRLEHRAHGIGERGDGR